MRESSNAREITVALRGKIEHAGEHERPPPREFRLDPRTDDELQQYVGVWHAAVGSGLGAMLDMARDNYTNDSLFPDFWKALGDLHDSRVLKKARHVAIALWGAHALYRPSVTVLWAYCHPTTVFACEGLYGNVGRVLALYPMTQTGRSAVDSLGRPLVRVGQNNPTDSLRQLNADRVQAKGDARRQWSAIRAEATEMRAQAFTAYITARRAVRNHDKLFHMAPTRTELISEIAP